jgi:hypothetical protein
MFRIEISETVSVTWLVLGELIVVLAVNVLPLFDPGPEYDVELVLTLPSDDPVC